MIFAGVSCAGRTPLVVLRSGFSLNQFTYKKKCLGFVQKKPVLPVGSGRSNFLSGQGPLSRGEDCAVRSGRHLFFLHPERPYASKQPGSQRAGLLCVEYAEAASCEVRSDFQLRETQEDPEESVRCYSPAGDSGRRRFLAGKSSSVEKARGDHIEK